MKYRVCAYKDIAVGFREFFFDDFEKARQKRNELLAILPFSYTVRLETVDDEW